MILDSLTLWHRYAPLHPRLGHAFAFLEQVRPDIVIGRHEIAGDDMFALVQRYQTRPIEGMQLEAHRRYIDVQYLVTGREAIHWAPLRAGQFMMLFPDDAHVPCCCIDAPSEVVKVVVKSGLPP